VGDAIQLGLGLEVAALLGLRLWAEPRGAGRRRLESPVFVFAMSGVALGQLLVLALALLAPERIAFARGPLPELVRALGLAIGGLGLVGMTAAHRALGRHYDSVLSLRDDHALVTVGPYRYARHPMYTALFLATGGIALATANALVAALLVGGLGVVVAVRLPAEERALAERFGAEWTAYAARTGRFLP
jgi:protein-S-isoprenylcysteine O-methyltransferase Ste14